VRAAFGPGAQVPQPYSKVWCVSIRPCQLIVVQFIVEGSN